MQPTGRRGRDLPLGQEPASDALWNVGLRAGRYDRPQLMRKSLGRQVKERDVSSRAWLTLHSLVILTCLAVPSAWLVALWPFITGRGSSPGAGAQYVYALVPTVAVSTIGLLVASPLQLRELRRSLVRPSWPFAVLAACGLLGAAVLVAYWIWVARRVLGDRTLLLGGVAA